MSQVLTQDKARQLLKELQYAKAATGGQLSVKEEYYKQALEDSILVRQTQETADLYGVGFLVCRHGGKPEEIDPRKVIINEVKQ